MMRFAHGGAEEQGGKQYSPLLLFVFAVNPEFLTSLVLIDISQSTRMIKIVGASFM